MADIPTWPVTIIRTRYGGIYERGDWAAFPLRAEAIPPVATGSDGECATFWDEFVEGVGVGATPDAALADLEQKIRSGRFYRGPGLPL